MLEMTAKEVDLVSGGLPKGVAGFIGGLVGTMSGADLTAAMTVDGLAMAGPVGAGVGFLIGAAVAYEISD